MAYQMRANPARALKLLDSNEVSSNEWEAHVDELHTFFGDVKWDGDDCSVYVHPPGAFTETGNPGDWAVFTKDPLSGGEIFMFVPDDQFEKVYEEI